MEIEIQEQRLREPIYQQESTIRLQRRRFLDRCARWIFSGGGIAIILSITGILIFLALEVWPLFRPARVKLLHEYSAGDFFSDDSHRIVTLGLDENQEVGYLIASHGEGVFFNTSDGRILQVFNLFDSRDTTITSTWQSLDGTRLVLGTNLGQAVLVEVQYNSRFFEGKRSYSPEVTINQWVLVDSSGHAIQKIKFAGDPEESFGLAVLTDDGRVVLYFQQKEESFLGEVEITTRHFPVPKRWAGRALDVALDNNLRNLYVGTSLGRISHWRVSPDSPPQFITTARVGRLDGIGVTTLQFLIGHRTLMVGDASGQVSAWSMVRDSTSVIGHRLIRIHRLQSHPAAVTFIAPSARNKGFISGDLEGNLFLQYTTSERFLARFGNSANGEVRFISFAPKSNGALVLDAGGHVSHWAIDNPHPEASLKAFFGKVWYEGYDKPEYVWQSTGGTDDFEPKLSLVPLIFGSIKGTIYALIIAIPLAILGALYTSQFMHPTYRNLIKPSIEIMAALPSVVLGFLAGLWLAPIMENIMPGVLMMFIVLPVLILLSSIGWRNLPRKWRGRFKSGIEGWLLVPVLVFGIWLCLKLNGPVEQFLFGGDFKQWLFATLGLPYDQRNAGVVGIAMGFAVIPIIYTISEDALSNVPKHLISGSLALGATPWQTAVRVVIPTAAAGIFSAIMIGFGRAVGETMIVLMATGNTPIMDWNPFNGFRTLSANIAVEIPEAPVGGTLYRVLFLSALLLFLITFLVNTLAEIVRQRMRTKYQKL